MHELHIILTWASVHKADLLGIVGGSAGLSVFLESLLLKLKKWHIDSHALALTLLHLVAVISAGAAWFLGNSLTGKATAGVYASLVIVAEVWQRFCVSPLFTKYVVPFLSYLSNQKPAPAVAPTEATPPDTFAA